MEFMLSKVTQQAMNYAIRSGITITSGFALEQCSRLLKTKHSRETEELGILQDRLESKIRIISPAIDMIELIAARGNTSLESAVSLTKSLRWNIQSLGVRLSKAAADEELSRGKNSKAKSMAENEVELKLIISDIKKLLEGIEDAVPLINLAITTSGVSLSTSLPVSVSPSRLLQASTFLTAGDSQYGGATTATQVGPGFTLSMYMLFSGHASRAEDEEGFRSTTWKEVIHKARVKLMRVHLDGIYDLPAPLDPEYDQANSRQGSKTCEREYLDKQIPALARADEFAYQLRIIEDLEDDRVHTFDDDDLQPGPLDDITLAGIREVVPIHEVSKIFYADTGKILNIGADSGANNPILLVKRDPNAQPPRRMMERDRVETPWHEDSLQDNEETEETAGNGKEQSELEAQFARETSVAVEEKEQSTSSRDAWRLPPGLDPAWIAFEAYVESEDFDSDSDIEGNGTPEPAKQPSRSSRQSSLDPSFTSALSSLQINSSPSPITEDGIRHPQEKRFMQPVASNERVLRPAGPIKTSLSLLEMLIRLTSLQQFQQSSHLAITDELLNFFLEESSTTGAAPGDSEERSRIRRDARQRVGFDPYDESPIKRRGEDYQYAQYQAWNGSYVSPVASRQGRSLSPTASMGQESKSPASMSSPAFRSAAGHSSNRSTSVQSTLDTSSPSRGVPPLPVRSESGSPATPSGSTKSRRAFLKDEVSKSAQQGSPLARSSSVLQEESL